MRQHLFCTVLGFALIGSSVTAQAQVPTSVPPSDAPTQTPGNVAAKPFEPVSAPLKIESLTLTGNQRIATATLLAAVPFKVGDKVPQARITEGLQTIMKVYQQHHLTGDVHQQLSLNGQSVKVTWQIKEATADAAEQQLVLDSVSFDGNLHVSKTALHDATRLRPGQTVTPVAMLADEKAMQLLYTKKNIGISIKPEVTHPHHDNRVNIIYHLDEKASD